VACQIEVLRNNVGTLGDYVYRVLEIWFRIPSVRWNWSPLLLQGRRNFMWVTV